MKKSILSIVTCFLISATSCVVPNKYASPAFKKEVESDLKILKDDLLTTLPYDIVVCGDYVAVLALNNGKWIQLYDKETGVFSGSYINQGNGPGEFAVASKLNYDEQTKELSVFDLQSGKFSTFSFNGSDTEKVNYKIDYNTSKWDFIPFNVFKLNDNDLLINGQVPLMSEKPQVRLHKTSGADILSQYNKFPEIESPDMLSAFVHQSATVSPNKTKFAMGTLFGGILETFELNSAIKPIKMSYFSPPNLDIVNGVMRHNTNTVWGFADLEAGDNYVYSVYIGDKDINNIKNVSIFDWKGNAVCKVNLPNMIHRLCVDVQESTLYAVGLSQDGGFNLVSLDLSQLELD